MKPPEKIPPSFPDRNWFKVLGDSVGFAIFAYRKNRFLFTNAAASEISGFSAEELAEKRVLDFLEPGILEVLPPFDRETGIFEESREPVEFPIVTREGRRKWVAVTNLHVDWEGMTIGVGTAVDVTARKRAEDVADRRMRMADSLNEISHRFLAPDRGDLEERVDFALKSLGNLTGAQCTFIIFLDDSQTVIVEEYWRHRGRFSHTRGRRGSLEEYGFDLDTLLDRGVFAVDGFAPVSPETGCCCGVRTPGQSFLAIPLVSEGRLLGVLGHSWADPGPPVDDDERQFLRVAGEILSNAIRRITVERELRQTTTRHELAQMAGRTIAWEWNPTTDEMIMPVSAADLYGFGPEVIPRTGLELNRRVVEEDRPRLAEALRRTMRTGETYLVEHRFRLPHSNEVLWISARGQAVLDFEGRPEKIIGVSTDITELKKAQQALQEERELAEVTLRSIGDGVFRCDVSGRIDYLNPAAETLTGWSSDEARGRMLDEVYRAMEDGTGRLRENPVAECIRQNRTIESPEWCSLFNRDGREFSVRDAASPIRDDSGGVVGAVLVVKDVSAVRVLEREMAFQASHDTLTGLLNRREFEARVHEALTNATFTGRRHALCYLDLDAFKVVNDTCGHSVGDQMLQQLAAVLEATARGTDILARLGGDEFGILMTDCSLEEAQERATVFLETVRDFRFLWQGRVFEVGVSVGIVPVTRESPRYIQVLGAADAACFVAKERGRNRIHISHPGDVEIARRHHEAEWVERLTRAIDRNHFVLYRQSIEPLQDRSKPTIVELLLRLADQEEPILPGSFIQAAERYRMMPSLDLWVIRNAFKFIRQDCSADPGRKDLYSINLSGQSLADRSVLDTILAEIDRNGIEPGRICFEITETAAISHLASAQAFIGVLRERGCHFALDDFGSGLSSFRYLKDLQVSYLKIDGSLVRDVAADPIHREMVTAIRQIGMAMGLSTIGEWVETEESLETLREIGLDYVQGFLLDRPKPI